MIEFQQCILPDFLKSMKRRERKLFRVSICDHDNQYLELYEIHDHDETNALKRVLDGEGISYGKIDIRGQTEMHRNFVDEAVPIGG